MEKDRKKKIITLLVIVFVTTLSIAFAALSRTLNINGTAKMDTASWNVHFDNLSKANLINTAEEVNEPNYADNKGTIENINVKLKNPKDEVIYTVDIVNDGTIDAEVTVTSLTELTEEESKLFDFGVYYSDGTKIIKYNLLEAGQKEEVTIKLRYKDDITEEDLPEVPLTINFGFTINYIQSDASMVVTPNSDLENVVSTLASGTDTSSTSTFFNGNITKESVESITFLSTLKVPKEVQSTAWDASLNKDGSVIAWYTDLDENNLYELNIGGNGKIYVEGGGYIFKNFNNVVSIFFGDVFDTSNATSMAHMFAGCSSLISLDLSSFDTSNVKVINHIFYGCSSLTNLDLNNWDTSNVTTMNCMFHSCEVLTELDLSGFDTSNVSIMSGMFYSCSSLTNLDLSSFNTSNVTSMPNMFRSCSLLAELDISNFNTSKVTTMERMFIYNSKLKSLDLNNFDTSNVTSMYQMFRGCSSLIELKVDNFNTEKVIIMGDMFYGCSKLQSLDLSSFNALNVTTMNQMFTNCSSLTSLDVSGFDTSKITSMYGMFNSCSSLTNLDLSSFDTSNVTNMSYMFENCSSLTSLDIRNADFSSVTSYSNMLRYVPTTSQIIVKDETQRTWLTSKFTNLTNVVLPSEL